MPGLFTYWHTLRHLRPVQFYGRLWFRLRKPRVYLRPAPPLRTTYRGEWIQPARRRISLLGPERLRFLNEVHALNDHGWDDPALEKLWRYNLHYFDDLNAREASARTEWHRALLSRWVRENPPALGTGWEPYPTSLRIVNWIKWALAGNTLPPECLDSLAVQARWLARRVEIHLLGNHLFANAKALLFAGLFFEGQEAATWQAKGFQILQRQVNEQILSDGGHFERSTMYHALALEDMLDLCNVTCAIRNAVGSRWQSTPGYWREQISAMRDWLAAMCHPDGEIAYFNDAAVGVAPAPLELDRYAARLGFPDRGASVPGLTLLAAAGYVRVEHDAAVALLDVAPVGPDYLPGHAHADTLSFELSLFGRRVFVNSGTSCYGNSAERLRQRGTAAHNTVVVDGQDSSEVWAGFRMGRRARPMGLEVVRNGAIEVRCAHDGYKRLPGRPTHLRQWRFGERELVVEDRVSGSFDRAQARFHLHPSVRLDQAASNAAGSGSVVLQLAENQKIHFSVEGGALRTEASTWQPEFGVSEPNLCLVVDFTRPLIRTHIDWKSAL